MTRSLSHFCSFSGDPAHRALRSFPTRRSSDLLDLRLAEVEDRAPISRPCLVVHDSLEEATVGVLSIDPGDDLVGIQPIVAEEGFRRPGRQLRPEVDILCGIRWTPRKTS